MTIIQTILGDDEFGFVVEDHEIGVAAFGDAAFVGGASG